MKNIKKYIKLFVIPFCAMALITLSCEKINVKYQESPYLTYVTDIQILNGGIYGDSIIDGRVDENKKEIIFPKLNKLTDLSKVKFGGKLPNGAHFEFETYDFSVDYEDGISEKRQVVAIVNEKRKCEYYVTIRLSVPVFGADFSSAKVYDYKTYADLGSGLVTRSADMDDTHILLVSRADNGPGKNGPYLLKISDIQDEIIDPIYLKTDGVSGGTFAWSSGCLAQKHIYIVNLAADVKIYHWADVAATPENIYSFAISDHGLTNRMGDDMSMHLDEDGNGYIFLGNNTSSPATCDKVLRIKVTDFTTLSDPTVLTMPHYVGYWSSYNLVDGATEEYLYTGNCGGLNSISLVSDGGSAIYTMPTAAPLNRAGSARTVNYNKEKYFALITGAGGSPSEVAIHLYDITRSSTTKEGLELLNPSLPKYKINLGGGNTGTYPASLAFGKTDDALFMFGSAPGAGFILVEAPFATEGDSFYDE